MLRFNRPRIPAPLRTLALSLVAVSGVALCALAVEVVQWLTTSPWHVLLVALLAGAAVAVSRALRSHVRRAHHAVRPEVTAGARPSPRRLPGTTPHKQTSRPRQQVVYYGGRCIGVMTEDGSVQLDSSSQMRS